MQKPRPGIDEEDDTAFGGLAPRSGPRTEVHYARYGGAGKWVAAIVAAVVVLLILLYITDRL
ncbi:hypothetical protein QTI24_02065 [Variovorax sp. J22P240]|uniref:hypothetical protein n=1 Tax=unclassified Variovorax TaxID=663243 RepID=UPI0025752609|nr:MULTISPECIES: hypothetical protein [unclassified Variovorax]MDL9997369.1 hypothetical protein [Variovorax sp. J22P240]MDM0048035.1 hypothetical protein [Variovorax sp. J22R115]